MILMIRGIVFDLWNSLAHDPGGPSPIRLLGETLGITGENGWNRRLERGMMLAPAAGIEAGLRQLEAREGLQLLPGEGRQAVLRRWKEASREAVLYPDVLPALKRLHAHLRIGLCSNTQSFGLEFLEREGLWQHLDGSAFSFEVGALKPRAEIFHSVLRRLNLAPETVLMVGDDRRDDVHGARALGMWAVRLARPVNGSRQGRTEEPGDTQDPPVYGLDELPQRVEIINQSV
jgi:putative hydrolase of the HAD superfamily